MTTEQALAFVAFALAAAGTPGPSNALLTATGANVGVRRGLPALLGVAIGMGLMMFLVAFGLGRAILDHPVALHVVRWCGAAFLCWLAWKIATARRAGVTPTGEPVGFLGAAALDHRAGSAVGQSAAFGLLFLLVALPSCFPWLAFGAFLQRFLRSERALRIFNGAMGALLAASVLLFVR